MDEWVNLTLGNTSSDERKTMYRRRSRYSRRHEIDDGSAIAWLTNPEMLALARLLPEVAALIEEARDTRDWLAGDMGTEANDHWSRLRAALAALEAE